MKKIITQALLFTGLALTGFGATAGNCCAASNMDEFKSRYVVSAESTMEEPAIAEAAVSTASFAASGNSKSLKETIRREIVGKITCPDFVTENSEANDVKALVSVDGQGRVTVFEIYSGNEKLKTYANNQLQQMKLSSAGNDEKFVLVIKFRVV